MSLRHSWNEEKLREAIATAEIAGEARLRFATSADAESFRFYCYKLRRRKGIGNSYSFVLDKRIEDDTPIFDVLIQKTPVFEMKRKIG